MRRPDQQSGVLRNHRKEGGDPSAEAESTERHRRGFALDSAENGGAHGKEQQREGGHRNQESHARGGRLAAIGDDEALDAREHQRYRESLFLGRDADGDADQQAANGRASHRGLPSPEIDRGSRQHGERRPELSLSDPVGHHLHVHGMHQEEDGQRPGRGTGRSTGGA